MSLDLATRMKRMLVVVPWIAAHKDGVPVESAVEFAGYDSADEFRKDLGLLQLIGEPPGAPDDLIEVDIDEVHVHVVLPQAFHTPPTLSAVECAALIAAAEPMGDAKGAMLERAIDKLKKALPEESLKALDELRRAAAIESPQPSRWHSVLQEAIDAHREVTLDYWAMYEGEAKLRTVEPRRVFIHGSHWYLAAWRPEAGEEHLYRLDRIRGVSVGTRAFGEHKGCEEDQFGRDVLFIGAERYPEVEVRFASAIARLALEQWGPLAKQNEDGSVTVVARMASEEYAVSWAMGFAGNVRFVQPVEYQRALERRAREMLEALARV